MRSTRQLSITLPVEMADMVKEKVAAGDYASESEVIREGLRALRDREAAVENWLRREVGEAYEEYVADPSTAIPLDDAFDRVVAELKERTGSKRK